MIKILLRDPVDFIALLLALAGLIWWLITKDSSVGGAMFLVAGYIFYVIYRFAVLYAKMNEYIKDPRIRKLLHLNNDK